MTLNAYSLSLCILAFKELVLKQHLTDISTWCDVFLVAHNGVDLMEQILNKIAFHDLRSDVHAHCTFSNVFFLWR